MLNWFTSHILIQICRLSIVGMLLNTAFGSYFNMSLSPSSTQKNKYVSPKNELDTYKEKLSHVLYATIKEMQSLDTPDAKEKTLNKSKSLIETLLIEFIIKSQKPYLKNKHFTTLLNQIKDDKPDNIAKSEYDLFTKYLEKAVDDSEDIPSQDSYIFLSKLIYCCDYLLIYQNIFEDVNVKTYFKSLYELPRMGSTEYKQKRDNLLYKIILYIVKKHLGPFFINPINLHPEIPMSSLIQLRMHMILEILFRLDQNIDFELETPYKNFLNNFMQQKLKALNENEFAPKHSQQIPPEKFLNHFLESIYQYHLPYRNLLVPSEKSKEALRRLFSIELTLDKSLWNSRLGFLEDYYRHIYQSNQKLIDVLREYQVASTELHYPTYYIPDVEGSARFLRDILDHINEDQPRGFVNLVFVGDVYASKGGQSTGQMMTLMQNEVLNTPRFRFVHCEMGNHDDYALRLLIDGGPRSAEDYMLFYPAAGHFDLTQKIASHLKGTDITCMEYVADSENFKTFKEFIQNADSRMNDLNENVRQLAKEIIRRRNIMHETMSYFYPDDQKIVGRQKEMTPYKISPLLFVSHTSPLVTAAGLICSKKFGPNAVYRNITTKHLKRDPRVLELLDMISPEDSYLWTHPNALLQSKLELGLPQNKHATQSWLHMLSAIKFIRSHGVIDKEIAPNQDDVLTMEIPEGSYLPYIVKNPNAQKKWFLLKVVHDPKNKNLSLRYIGPGARKSQNQTLWFNKGPYDIHSNTEQSGLNHQTLQQTYLQLIGENSQLESLFPNFKATPALRTGNIYSRIKDFFKLSA